MWRKNERNAWLSTVQAKHETGCQVMWDGNLGGCGLFEVPLATSERNGVENFCGQGATYNAQRLAVACLSDPCQQRKGMALRTSVEAVPFTSLADATLEPDLR